MTDNQWNKLTMYQVLIRFLEGVETRITTATALIALVTCFKPVVAAIEAKSQKQITPTSQNTIAKNSAKDLMIELLARIARAGKLYAQNNNKSELLGIFDIKIGKLQIMREEELKERAALIHSNANLIKADILQYGVTQQKLDNLNTLIINFLNGIDIKEGALDTKEAATKSLPELFGQAEDILEEMDDIVDIIDDDYPDFGVEYRIARKVVDLGGGGSSSNNNEDDPPVPPPTPN